MQTTIRNPVSISGIGLHSGKKSVLQFIPARENTGVVFIRDNVKIPALASYVTETTLCTTLEHNNKKVKTVEHLMAAIAAMGIDNLQIVCSNEEIPILDGSSTPFLIALSEAGIRFQDSVKKVLRITKPVEVWQDDKVAMLLPSDVTTYHCEIDFNHPLIGRQVSFVDDFSKQFKEIAKARTFGFVKDIEYLKEKGLALGGTLENCVVLDDYSSLNELRCSDEFARHKLLDAIGDLRLLGTNFIGKFYSYKGGHHINNVLCREVLRKKAYEIVEVRNERRSFNRGGLSCLSV